MSGILSGLEIADAVERQMAYNQLKNRYDSGEGLWFWDLRRMRKLSKLPRIWIDNFRKLPTYKGGRCGPNSYDLTLADTLKIYNQADCLDARKDNPTRELTIPADGLVLWPGTLYLGQTVEYTESHNCVPYIDGRSSMGRLGFFCHITAGAGDAGFKGRWVVEICVVQPLKIYPSMSVAQIRFVPISPNHIPYQSKKYQDQRQILSSRLWMENKKEADA